MNSALVLAGGSGTRMGIDIPKQYYEVNGRPIITYILETLEKTDCIDRIYIAATDEWKEHVRILCRQYSIQKLRAIVSSGSTRQESNYNGIMYMATEMQADDVVCILDANRPLTSRECIEESVQVAREYGAALAVEPCYDGMYDCRNQYVWQIADRSVLYHGKTPESVLFGVAQEVLHLGKKDALTNMTITSLLVHYGKGVRAIQGEKSNFKITTTEDLLLLRAYLQIMES